MSPSGKASDFDSDIRRFESGHPSQFDPLAQSVEQLPFKQWVRGSSPRRVTRKQEIPFGIFCFLPFRGLERSNSSVRRTDDCRQLDGGNSFIPIPSEWECKRAPTGHQKAEDTIRNLLLFAVQGIRTINADFFICGPGGIMVY